LPTTPQLSPGSSPPVVVCSVFQTGLNLMRDLERHGLRAVGIDCDAGNPGFRSRYGRSYLCPNPDGNPAEWVAFMRSLSRELGSRAVIIPAADIFVDALGRHADELEADYIFSRAAVSAQARLVNKDQQYALAAAAGLPCPRTSYIGSCGELDRFFEEARFPCLLKPLAHREWEGLPVGNPFRGRKVVTADTADELRAHYLQVQPFRPKAVAQEIVAGADDSKFCYLAVYGSDRRRLGYLVVHELRCQPVRFGSASIVEPVVDEEIAGICDRFLRQVGYVGLCEIEVKRDLRDGRVLLIEVNPRFSVTFDCAIYAGVEAGWLHYLDLAGRSPAPMEASRFDFRHIVLQRDAKAFPQYLQAGLTTWRQWWGAYRGPTKFWDVDWHDWKVTGSNLYNALRPMAGGLLRHWGLRRRSTGGAAG
jgi:D-aspartate ligase